VESAGVRIAPLAALALLACSDPAGPGIRMDAARSTSFWDAPFPSNDLLKDGRVDISGFPNPGRIDLVRRGVDLLGRDAHGFGLASGVFFAADVALDPSSVNADSVRLLDAATGEAHRADLFYAEDGGPFGTPHMIVLLPENGAPLAPATTYVAIVSRDVHTAEGEPLAVARSEMPDTIGVDPDTVAGFTVFRTDDPLGAFDAVLARGRARLSAAAPVVVQSEIFPDYCVFSGEITLPDFQEGELPYTEDGGAWSAGDAAPKQARSRLVVTIPRRGRAAYPAAVFIRTGGGGDRPLVDRGLHAIAHGPAIEPGSGPALELARVGYAGVSVDGPHGGPRNPSGADEQFLMFNFQNPAALRDNVRQSALEIALLPALLERLEVDTSSCPGALPRARIDTSRLALIGHSMGATIAPLAAYGAPEYRALIMSGAGASWIENLLHKLKPLSVKVLAEALIGYTDRGAQLAYSDPVLSLVQWAIEPADPLVFAPALVKRGRPHVLMFQGIVDHYIMPPIATALSVALRLDHGGPILDREVPELAAFDSLAERLQIAGLESVRLPARANRSGLTALVVQTPEDGLEDGHEVLFQTELPKRQYRCFLATLAATSTGAPPLVIGADDMCPLGP